MSKREKQQQTEVVIMSCVYVDDQSFASSRAWSIHDKFHAWSAWSTSVALLEKNAKAVALASTPDRRATVRRTLPEVVANDVELLGSCSMISRRGLLPKESAWVDACRRVLALLACACLSFERYLHESLPSVCNFQSCLRLDCECPSSDLVCAVMELCACWQSPHSVGFGVVTCCPVWGRHAF